MNKKESTDRWVYIVVQDPESEAQILGQHDEESDIFFIPAFGERDTALQCLGLMTKDKDKKYEAQAMLLNELEKDAAQGGFLIFIMDENGNVIEKLEP